MRGRFEGLEDCRGALRSCVLCPKGHVGLYIDWFAFVPMVFSKKLSWVGSA